MEGGAIQSVTASLLQKIRLRFIARKNLYCLTGKTIITMNGLRPHLPLRYIYLVAITLPIMIIAGKVALAARIHLKNGVTLQGEVARVGTLVTNPNASSNEEGGKHRTDRR